MLRIIITAMEDNNKKSQCLKIIKNVTFEIFKFLAFSTNFCPIKSDLSGNTVLTANFRFFKNSPKWTIFGLFNELLSTQNVNVARFARNVEWDFSFDFQTPCIFLIIILGSHPPKSADFSLSSDRLGLSRDHSPLSHWCSQQVLALGKRHRLALQNLTIGSNNTRFHGFFHYHHHCFGSIPMHCLT